MQQRATIWILGAFCTSSSFSIKTIVDLIPIYLHLQKLSGRFQLRMQKLPQNHIIKSFLESRYINNSNTYQLSLEMLTPRQQLLIKDPIVDANNKLNGVFPSFYLFSSKFSPEDRLIDILSSCFSFYSVNRRSEEGIKVHICKLNNITFQALCYNSKTLELVNKKNLVLG